jgi:hypothetical protein
LVLLLVAEVDAAAILAVANERVKTTLPQLIALASDRYHEPASQAHPVFLRTLDTAIARQLCFIAWRLPTASANGSL